MYKIQINRYSTFTLLVLLFTTIDLSAQEPYTAADHYRIARTLYRTSPKQAIIHGQKTMDLGLEERDLLIMGKAHFLLGYIYDYQDDVANAFHFYFGGIKVYQKLGMPNRIQQLYENLAYIAERKGVHVVAEQLRNDRLDWKDKVDYRIASDMHYDLGLSLKHQGEISRAFGEQLAALRLLETNPDLSDTSQYANIWLEMGVLYRMQASASNNPSYLDSALQSYTRAAHFNNGDQIHDSKLQNNRGNVYRLLGNFDKSKKSLNESIQTAEDKEKLKIHGYFNLGRVYYAEQKIDSAVLAFTKSLEINIEALGYEEAQLLPQQNIELSKAPELFQSMAYLDSLGVDDLEIKGRAMRHVYRLAKERYEIISANNNSMIAQLYEKHKEDLAQEARLSMLKTWGLVIMLFIAALAAVWFWWRRYTVRQHNRKLGAQMEKRLKDKYGIELKD